MVEINLELCTGCGECVRDCSPRKLALKNGKANYAGECLSCGHCVAICPVGAVSIPTYDMADVEELTPGRHLDIGELLTAIKGRRSIRQYQDKKVEREKLELILEAGRYSATARNVQGTRFIFVQEGLPEFRDALWHGLWRVIKENGPGTRELKGMANLKKYKGIDFLLRDAPVVVFILTDNIWDAGLAAQNMEHAALAQGLGVLYNAYLQRAAMLISEAGDFLGLDGRNVAACMLLGYPAVEYKRSVPRIKADALWL